MTDSPDLVSALQERLPPFAKVLGMKFLVVTPDRLVAEMLVRDDLCTTRSTAHGGAIMAFADTLGACATVVNLKKGFITSTLESKTNFFAPAPAGQKVTGESVALHRGRLTMAWQTRITSESGKLIAVVTQTQIILEQRPVED